MAKNNKTFLVLLAVVVVVVGILLNLQQWGRMSQAKADLAAEKQQLTLLETRLNALMALDAKKESMEADLAVLSQLMPGAALESELIVDLQSGADLSDMKLVQVRFGDRVEHEGYTEMPVMMVLSGTYYEVLHFLDYLSVYERAVRVDELRLDTGQENKDEMMVSIRLSAFYAQ